MKQFALALCLIAMSAAVVAVRVTAARPTAPDAAVLAAVQGQIEKEQRFGYTNFALVHTAHAGASKVRLVYTTDNHAVDPRSTKYLTGFTVTRNAGQWFYVGSRKVAYRTSDDLTKMRSWADAIGK